MLSLAVGQNHAGSLGKHRQKGLAPAKAYKDIKMIHCWNNGWLYDWQLNRGNRCLQRKMLSSSSSLLLCWFVDASMSAYLGHSTNVNVVYQSLGLIWDLTALERNVFDLEGIADQQAVSTFCLFSQTSLSLHLNPFLRRSQTLPFQHRHLAHLLLLHLAYTQSHHRFLSFLHLHPLSSIKPACTLPTAASTPTTVFLSPSPGRPAGFPAGGPDGVLASQPALGLWVCRMAAWPFCGRYGRGQSWHLSVTMDQQGDGKAGTQNRASTQQNEGLTVERWTNTLRCDLAAILSMTTRRCMKQETGCPGWCSDSLVSWKCTSGALRFLLLRTV